MKGWASCLLLSNPPGELVCDGCGECDRDGVRGASAGGDDDANESCGMRVEVEWIARFGKRDHATPATITEV